MTQREENPFQYSDSNKRYHTYDYFLKKKFGGKVAKISLDAGFTCPNIDGTCGNGGCIYCSGGSSGAQCNGSLIDQYLKGIEVVRNKWNCNMFIPYLQAHTNTYSDINTLKNIYETVLKFEDSVMIAIATRADCLGDDVIGLLYDISQKKPIIIELGLQSSNDNTAKIIKRGHSFIEFIDGYTRLKSAGGNIYTCIHLIDGLPGENIDNMLKTAEDVSALHPDMVKIHLLHVLKGTELEKMYERGEYLPLTQGEYTDIVVRQLELMPPEVVIARITGDGVGESLIAPEWSRKKTIVSNDIDKLQYQRKSYQGIHWNNILSRRNL